jgi:hypothetical protein
MRALFHRIGAEADAIVCASEGFTELFAPFRPTVVGNGAPAAILATEATAPPRTATMVYAGTLSERFDAPFVDALLSALPEWRLDLYGQCQYAGRGGEPAAELAALLARWPKRITWHGPVARDRLGERLDDGDVLVLPHRRSGAVDGDSMKLYDYAARGRPIAATRCSEVLGGRLPPHTYVADTTTEFADAIRRATSEPAAFAHQRRRWAEENGWQARWQAWSEAVLG